MKITLFILSLSLLPASFAEISNEANTQYEIAACAVNTKVKNTASYHNLASVNTDIICDIGTNVVTGTLHILYNEGWRLIQVVSVDNRLSTKAKSVPHALMYLERIKP